MIDFFVFVNRGMNINITQTRFSNNLATSAL